MDIKGKVHEISQVITVSDKFKKRELILEYAENPTYPEYVKFEAVQDKVNLFDNVKVGDQVELFFNLRGRPWTDKTGKTSYFNTLSVWRLNPLGAETSSSSAPEYAPPVDITSAPDDDDLPF
ncbi:DUF3127 domain-containing protein [Daejeonella lutea]|uniref:DUF3127 domain-containing protein n=1 Tax=Daejeonella lutea TaxID=572036 RepID=A0A1T5DV88_9SPHI|nr:DUF3127 domain-containing protein [Daejeonella lutea]SKB75549.1 protein of unknown function [Daejeonella lutea]